QRPARHRDRDTVLGPLGSDQRGQAHRRIASLTQRAAERLSTSRSIASSAFSLRSRFSSSRSFSLNGPSPSRARRSRFTHRPSVPSFRPSSRATRAIGLPVSRTIRTAPSLNSRSKFRRSIANHFLRGDVSTVRGEAQYTVKAVSGQAHYIATLTEP